MADQDSERPHGAKPYIDADFEVIHGPDQPDPYRQTKTWGDTLHDLATDAPDSTSETWPQVIARLLSGALFWLVWGPICAAIALAVYFLRVWLLDLF